AKEPRIGGVNKSEIVAWTGGSNVKANRLQVPKSYKACRPTSFKDARSAERDCSEGLSTDRLLKPPKTLAQQKAEETETRKCFNCGEEGHIQKDCKKPKDNNKGNKKAGNKNNSDNKTTVDRNPPKEGESSTRTRDGVVEKWCGVCTRWTKGEGKAHLTKEHKKRGSNDGDQTKKSEKAGGNLAGGHPGTVLMTGFMGALKVRDAWQQLMKPKEELQYCSLCDQFEPAKECPHEVDCCEHTGLKGQAGRGI
ncbi:MAG: zinc finger CCHC domain-containing protein, partial [Gaiellaceae bacterium]